METALVGGIKALIVAATNLDLIVYYLEEAKSFSVKMISFIFYELT
jgi:hypothetical protein